LGFHGPEGGSRVLYLVFENAKASWPSYSTATRFLQCLE